MQRSAADVFRRHARKSTRRCVCISGVDCPLRVLELVQRDSAHLDGHLRPNLACVQQARCATARPGPPLGGTPIHNELQPRALEPARRFLDTS